MSTIGGRELAHNLICRHSAIVLPFGTDVRSPRHPSVSPTFLSTEERKERWKTLLQPLCQRYPSPLANALIRTLQACNTYIRSSEGAAMLAPSCMYIVYPCLTLRFVKQTSSTTLFPPVFHSSSSYSLPTLVASRIEVRTRFSHYVGDLPSFGHLAIT